ncbi:MAG: hypothetical protein KAT35_03265, partial [Candidatus Aenigmarchaeota archaeon]|nr:hypothetical protein [Candidatus Aenigmarchaeota archaeon]
MESDDATKEYKKESCESKYKLACHDGHVYWFDSCGNEQEKYKYCAHGCEVGDCVEADDCEPHDEHACHNGHVYWYDSCGNKEEKKEYCEHGCANGVCVESGEEADSELICCESYGLGAMMVKCCESYEWTTTEECNVPEGFVGGGKNIADDSYCEEECYESDDGYDIYNAGVAEAGDQRLEDHCNDDGTLTEKYCEGNEIKWKSVPCPGGYSCIDARCVMLYECTDTDDEVEDGLNYYKKGTTYYREKGVLLKTETDYCGTEGAEEGNLREYYCVGATFKSKLYKCEPGKVCDGGACVIESVVEHEYH